MVKAFTAYVLAKEMEVDYITFIMCGVSSD